MLRSRWWKILSVPSIFPHPHPPSLSHLSSSRSNTTTTYIRLIHTSFSTHATSSTSHSFVHSRSPACKYIHSHSLYNRSAASSHLFVLQSSTTTCTSFNIFRDHELRDQLVRYASSKSKAGRRASREAYDDYEDDEDLNVNEYEDPYADEENLGYSDESDDERLVNSVDADILTDLATGELDRQENLADPLLPEHMMDERKEARREHLSKEERLKIKARDKRRAKLLGTSKDPTISEELVRTEREKLARARKKRVDLLGQALANTEKEEQEAEWRAFQEARKRQKAKDDAQKSAEQRMLEGTSQKLVKQPVQRKSKSSDNGLGMKQKKEEQSDDDDDVQLILNEEIRAREISVVDMNGKRLGLFTRATALKIAEKNELDLLLMSPPDAPKAVARLVQLDKYLYYEGLKEKAAERKAKPVGIHTMQIRPVISENDMKVKLNRVREWLKQGWSVKVVYYQPTPELKSTAHFEKFFIRIALELADTGVTHTYTEPETLFTPGKLKKLPEPQHFDVKELPVLAKLLDPEFEDPLRPTDGDGAFQRRNIRASGTFHMEGFLKMKDEREQRVPIQKGKSESYDGNSEPTRFPDQKGQGPKHQAGYSWYAKNEIKDD